MANLIIDVKKIEDERRRLRQASAILACAAWAANHDVEADYGDVMEVARRLVDDAANALDVVALRRRQKISIPG